MALDENSKQPTRASIDALKDKMKASLDGHYLGMIRVALYVAGSWSRRIVETNEEIDQHVKETMEREEIPLAKFADVRVLTEAFFAFGECVRAAERNKHPIVPALGERPPKTGQTPGVTIPPGYKISAD